MAASNLPGPGLARHRVLLSVLVALAAAALYFVQHNALKYYASFDAATYGDFWPRRWGLVAHVAGGVTAVGTGLVQLWLGLTGRIGAVHRALGRVYVGAIVVGSAAAYYLALTIDPKYFAYAAGLFMLSTSWVVTTGMALVAVRHRALEQHREWMIRSYTVTFAFVTFRLVERWLLPWHLDTDDNIDIVMAWACWSVPLLLAEPLLQLRKIRRR
jgi:uncharacterized membrane protein